MELSRKDFLRAGAAAWTAGAFNIVPSTVFGANAPSNRINMALVGCGGQGCADMGGLKCMLRLAAKREGFDYDRFFRSFAYLWI